MTQVTWVVGARGLLGRSVSARADRHGQTAIRAEVPWGDPAGARAALRAGIRALQDRAAGGSWNVAWCAGAGVVGTPPAEMEAERVLFAGFLEDLAEACGGAQDGAQNGAVFFSSSAGGVYAGSAGTPFTEATAPRPLAPYGETKLAMEAMVHQFASRTGVPTMIGRIANLYGPGQDLSKPQGLVSQLCRSLLTGQPLPVYVSLDTRRNYLFVDDCADMVLAGLSGLRDRATEGEPTTKILTSGASVTIGTLVAEAFRIFRRRPRIQLGATPLSVFQVRDLRLGSTEWTELDRFVRTPLPVGLAATARDVARQMVRRVPDQQGQLGSAARRINQ